MSRESVVSPGAGTATPVEELAPGQVVAEAVHDQQGRLLVPAGTELTERHLRAFQLWGVVAVRVQSSADEEPPPPPVSPEELARAEELVRARLVRNDPAHPMIAELLRVVALREATTGAGRSRRDAPTG